MRFDDFYSGAPDAALSYAHTIGKRVGVDGLSGLCAKAKRLWRAFTQAMQRIMTYLFLRHTYLFPIQSV